MTAPPTELILLMTTLPDAPTAEALAAQLIEQKLAACVQILPPGQSVYWWAGAVVREPEQIVLIKTLSRLQPAATTAILAAHPYEVPELIGLRLDYASPAYVDWVVQTLARV